MWKFRTMACNASALGPGLTVGDDPRVTRVGRFLRRFKLDELPQLINVISGDMNLVGPRPELQEYVDLFVTEYRELLRVRPGITDLASIAYRDEAAQLAEADDPVREYVTRTLPRKITLSREGIERSSFWFDVTMILATVFGPGLAAGGRLGGARNALRHLGAVAMRHRRVLVVVLHLALAAMSNVAAYALRFDGALPPADYAMMIGTLGWLLVVRGLAFAIFRVNQGLWRYASLWDLRCIVIGVTTSSVAWYLIVHWVWQQQAYPRSVFVIDAVLLVCLMCGVRLARRVYLELLRPRHGRRVVIVSEGDTAEIVVRDMEWHAHDKYVPIGLVDRDRQRAGETIHGVPVLGGWDDLPQVIGATLPQEVLIAVSRHDPAALRRLMSLLEPFDVVITMLPWRDAAAGDVGMERIRRVSVEDLLERPPIDLDRTPVQALLTAKRVLVTGAGGSIGSELCAQIAAYGPSDLVLYERYENNLYGIVNALEDRGLALGLHPMVGDVTDPRRLDAIFARYKPEVVFHAAAHKHVPLMEANPCEAVKNNVAGTRLVAEAAARHGADRMILISSDKAVNPASVMGATKRIAELVIGQCREGSGTRYSTVRFGNVLGSNGSVVPRFLEQIRSGGPVTVTHPEMRRYFMLISEAVELVLHAAATAETGAIYVLEMGEQLRLVDLARSLIRLAGYRPDEVPVIFTGLRPGEKLSEQLIDGDEHIEPSAVPKVLRIRASHALSADLRIKILELERLAETGDEHVVMTRLRDLLPSFTPGLNPGDCAVAGVSRMPAAPAAVGPLHWAVPAAREVR
jgi:FlaA1/EpsC-like NDP-sugar epimerase